jgi:hypothetical protein
MSAFAGLLRKEWLHILRDRRTLLFIVVKAVTDTHLLAHETDS